MRARRTLRRAGLSTAGLLLFLLLLALVLALLPASRNWALREALRAVGDALPGELSYEGVHWSLPLHIRVDEPRWTDGADTLAAASRLEVDLRPGPLWQRDLHADQLVARAVWADIPRIRAQFGGARADSTARGGGGGDPFPRPGSLAPLPSLAVDELVLSARQLTLPDGAEVRELHARARVQLRAGRPPLLQVAQLDGRGRWRGQEFRLESEGDLARQRIAVLLGDRRVVDLELRAEPGDGRPEAIHATGQLDPPPPDLLAAFPVYGEWLSRLRVEQPPVVHFSSTTTLAGEPSLQLRFRSPGRGPLPAVSTRLWASRDSVQLDSLVVAGGAVLASASAGRTGPARRARLQLDVHDLRWLQPWWEGAPAPRATPLHIELDLLEPEGGEARGTLELEHEGWRARAIARLEGRSPLALRLQPLRVAPPGRSLPGPREGDPWGRAVQGSTGWNWEGLRVAAPGLRLDSDGRHDVAGLDARVDLSTTAAALQLAGPWLPASAAPLDSLRAHFVPSGVDARLQGPPWRAGGSMQLPPPAFFARLAGAGLPAPIAGPLRGDWRARQGEAGEWSFAVDLGASEGLEELVLEGRYGPAASRIDTLRLGWHGLRLAGTAVATVDSLRGHFALELPDARAVRRLVPGATDSLELELAADIRVGGTRATPTVRTEFAGRAARGPWAAPELVGRATLGAGPPTADLRLPSGLRGPGLQLDRVEIGLRPERRDQPLPLWLRVDTEGPDLVWGQVVRIDRRGPGWELRSDSLHVAVQERSLDSRGPFVVDVDSSGVALRGLDLAGSMGQLAGGVSLREDSVRVDLALELEMGERPAALTGLPPGLWPRQLTARLESERADSLRGRVQALGLRLGPGGGMDLHLRARSGPAQTVLEGAVGQGEGDVLVVEGSLPTGVRLWPFEVVEGRGEVDLQARFRGFPLPPRWAPGEALDEWLAGGGDTAVPRLDGELRAQGSRDDAVASARLSVDFAELRRLRRHGVRVALELREPGQPLPPAWPDSLREALPGAARPSAGRQLRAHAAWTTGGRGQLEFGAQLPMEGWGLDRSRPLALRADAQRFPVGELEPLLPEALRVGGEIDLGLRAEGRWPDPGLGGELRWRGAELELAGGSEIYGEARLQLQGSATAPVLDGRVTVDRGTIVLPEAGRELLPAEGESRLWTLMPDSTLAAPARPGGEAGPNWLAGLRSDVVVEVPATLDVAGRGLELTLQGQLELGFAEGRPSLVGELTTVDGNYSFLGRRFEVERGRATFYGGDEVDPTLDITLRNEKDGVGVFLEISGRASEPRLALRSEPAMAEAEIFSHLLFGRRTGQLDSEQNDFLRSKALEALEGFAVPRLEAELARQLGVDLLRIERGAVGESSRFTVGKYISPRALLKLQQGLGDWPDAAVELEYWIGRGLKLESHVARQGSSGLELNWSRDY